MLAGAYICAARIAAKLMSSIIRKAARRIVAVSNSYAAWLIASEMPKNNYRDIKHLVSMKA